VPLYCILLNPDGTLGGEMVPIGPGKAPIQLTDGAVPAIPVFVDEDTGEMMARASKLGLELAADPFGLRLDRAAVDRLCVEVPPGYRLRQSADLTGLTEAAALVEGVFEVNPQKRRRMFYRSAFDSFFDHAYP
jgi:hypothetical protein